VKKMNLPDLEPTDIGIIAFWNALDHWLGTGEKSIDPIDCASVLDSYDVYDNGIQGWKALGSGRHINARVKSDGWMIAWIDRTNSFAYPSKSTDNFGATAHKGYYDILWNWITGGNISSTKTTLSHLISLLYNALSNKDDFGYVDEDVGHYCYEYPDANVLTLTDIYTYVYGCCYKTSSKTGYIQYTGGTTLYYAAVTAYTSATNKSDNYSKAEFDGHLLAESNPNQIRAGTADLIAEGWIPNPLTSYPCYVYTYCSEDWVKSHLAILIIWA